MSSTELATGSVIAGKIAASAVTTTEIADGTITAVDIATDAVTASEIATSAVGTAEISDGSITAVDIATDAVGSTEIAAGAVSRSEISGTEVELYRGIPACGTSGDLTLSASCQTALCSSFPILFYTCLFGCSSTVPVPCDNMLVGYLLNPSIP